MGDKSTVEVLKEKAQGLSKEVAELERAEQMLKKSEAKYKKLMENSLTGIYIDQEGKIALSHHRYL